jgi:hypothetical protein
MSLSTAWKSRIQYMSDLHNYEIASSFLYWSKFSDSVTSTRKKGELTDTTGYAIAKPAAVKSINPENPFNHGSDHSWLMASRYFEGMLLNSALKVRTKYFWLLKPTLWQIWDMVR